MVMMVIAIITKMQNVIIMLNNYSMIMVIMVGSWLI